MCVYSLRIYSFINPFVHIIIFTQYKQLQSTLAGSFTQDIQGGAVALLKSNLRLRTAQLAEKLKEDFSPSDPPIPTAAFDNKLVTVIAEMMAELDEKYGRAKTWDVVDDEDTASHAGDSDVDVGGGGSAGGADYDSHFV